MVNAALALGLRSTVIVPSPTTKIEARTTVLYLSSSQEGFYESDGYPAMKLVARGLAMEIGLWTAACARDELRARCRLTDADLLLLRFELQGHGSKEIAAALRTEAKTIDCRFQRVIAKLGAANRREALRLARLYELL